MDSNYCSFVAKVLQKQQGTGGGDTLWSRRGEDEWTAVNGSCYYRPCKGKKWHHPATPAAQPVAYQPH